VQENEFMNITKAKDFSIPADVMAALEYAGQMAASGRKDPAFAKRIADQAARIREAVKLKHGLLDIGVPAIRELRDG
jgi:hypothetical protein